MKIKMLYGKEGLDIQVPEDATVLRTEKVKPIYDEKSALISAIRHPIQKAPLAKLVNAQSRVVITHSDITRATPNRRILPAIIQELEDSGVQKQNITLINALGTHRKQTPDEMRMLLGKNIFDNYRCIQHDAFNNSMLVNVGTSSFGNPIRINKVLLEADVKILTGFIEPHFFAGFSGGPKAILPALAGYESVYSNHSYHMIAHPNARFNITEDNPIWEEMREAANMIDNTFLVNVTLDERHRISGVFAGDVIEAHKAGCQFLRKSSQVEVETPFDIAVTTNSGYPLDQNLYQCVKGLSAAHGIVRKDGAIMLLARCEEGLPPNSSYSKLLEKAETPEGILNMLSKPGFMEPDAWQVQIQARILHHAEVHVFSEGLSDQEITSAMMTPCRDIQETLQNLIEHMGKRICVIPEGPLVMARLKQQ